MSSCRRRSSSWQQQVSLLHSWGRTRRFTAATDSPAAWCASPQRPSQLASVRPACKGEWAAQGQHLCRQAAGGRELPPAAAAARLPSSLGAPAGSRRSFEHPAAAASGSQGGQARTLRSPSCCKQRGGEQRAQQRAQRDCQGALLRCYRAASPPGLHGHNSRAAAAAIGGCRLVHSAAWRWEVVGSRVASFGACERLHGAAPPGAASASVAARPPCGCCGGLCTAGPSPLCGGVTLYACRPKSLACPLASSVQRCSAGLAAVAVLGGGKCTYCTHLKP